MNKHETNNILLLIMSGLVMNGDLPKESNNQLKKQQLINQLATLKKAFKKEPDYQFIKITNDLWTYLTSLRNFYCHFWTKNDQKENSLKNKAKKKLSEIENNSYQFSNTSPKTFIYLVKKYLIKFILADDINIEIFRIALLSIFITKYDSDRLVKQLVNNNPHFNSSIKDILNHKSNKPILLDKDLNHKEYTLSKTSPINDILFFVQETNHDPNNIIDLTSNKNNLSQSIIKYFTNLNINHNNDLEILNYNNVFGAWAPKTAKFSLSLVTFTTQQDNWIIFEKHLMNFLILFYHHYHGQDLDNTGIVIDYLDKIKNLAENANKDLEQRNRKISDNQKQYDKKAFLTMLKTLYKNPETKSQFIRQSLKWINKSFKMKEWIPNDLYTDQLDGNWTQSITSMEIIKKAIFFNDYQAAISAGDLIDETNSHCVGYYFITKLLNIKKTDWDFSRKIFDFIKSKYDDKDHKFSTNYIAKELEWMNYIGSADFSFFTDLEKNQKISGKLIRPSIKLQHINRLIDDIFRTPQLKALKFKNRKSNKIFICYYILIALNIQHNAHVNQQLLTTSYFKTCDFKDIILYNNKKELIQENTKHQHKDILRSYFFKSILKFYKNDYSHNKEITNEDFINCLNFYDFYIKHEFKFIMKVKNWDQIDDLENQVIHNLVMHRNITNNDLNNLIDLNQNVINPNSRLITLQNKLKNLMK